MISNSTQALGRHEEVPRECRKALRREPTYAGAAVTGFRSAMASGDGESVAFFRRAAVQLGSPPAFCALAPPASFRGRKAVASLSAEKIWHSLHPGLRAMATSWRKSTVNRTYLRALHREPNLIFGGWSRAPPMRLNKRLTFPTGGYFGQQC
jgi:hypothetical protein